MSKSRPRDHHVADRIGLVKAARLFSNVISPPVMFACLGLALALRALPFWEGVAWAAVYGFFVSLAPILFVLYLLHTGRIEELHMTNTRERHLPYLVGVSGALVVMVLSIVFQVPQLLRCLALFSVLTLGVLGVVNTRWLISFHTTAVTALVVVVGRVFGFPAGVALAPLVLLVIAVRLYLKRHTVAQVAAGVVLGVLAAWSLTLIGCF